MSNQQVLQFVAIFAKMTYNFWHQWIILQNILVIHGPNLNLLGSREPHLYGELTLSEVNDRLYSQAHSNNFNVICKQSNAEHELIDMVQTAPQNDTAAIIINAAGYSHTSIALRDALAAVAIPFIEVHITNTNARESFRNTSYLADIAKGSIVGLGVLGYELALSAFISIFKNQTQQE